MIRLIEITGLIERTKLKVVIIALSNALKGQKLIAQGNTLGFLLF